MSVAESLAVFGTVLARASSLGWWRRAYVSTAFGCPYTGRVEPSRAVEVGLQLLELGADEVCFGDTIGVAVPSQVRELTRQAVSAGIPLARTAYHFHDTRGTGLANVVAGLDAGVRCFDASSGGTGGCPYAPGATSMVPAWRVCWKPPDSSPASWASRSPRRSARRVAGIPQLEQQSVGPEGRDERDRPRVRAERAPAILARR